MGRRSAQRNGDHFDIYRRAGASVVLEANGRNGYLGNEIRGLVPGQVLVGPARTVAGVRDDNLAIHLALGDADPGEVVCFANPGPLRGYWGGLLTRYAIARGVAGFVTNNGVRDVDDIAQLSFPVYCGGVSPVGTEKREPGVQQTDIQLGGVIVRPADVLVCDADGCVRIRGNDVATVSARAQELLDVEGLAKGYISSDVSVLDALNRARER